MSEVKKLNKEEIAQIKEMQAQYNKFVFELGSMETQLADVTAHIDVLKSEKSKGKCPKTRT